MRVFVSLLLVPLLSVKCTRLQLGFMSSHGGSFNSNGSVPAALLAVELINNQTDILEGYELKLQSLNSLCDSTLALEEYFRFWTTAYNAAPIIVGGGCSVASEPIAAVSHFWKTIQITFASSSPTLSNKEKYPYHFRVLPPESLIHRAQGIFVSMYGWQRVGLVYQYESLFIDDLTEIENFFKDNLMISNPRTFQFVSRLPLDGLNQLWENPPRAIIINAYQAYAREVLCQAYMRQIYYPAYQFVLLGWYNKDSWKDTIFKSHSSKCSYENILTVLENAVTVENVAYPSNLTSVGISGLTTKEINSTYTSLLEDERFSGNTHFTVYGIRAFDAVFAAALALNNSIANLKRLNLTLADFNFEDYNTSALFANEIRNQMKKLIFQGATGPVLFNDKGDRIGARTVLSQYRTSGGLLQQRIIGEIDFASQRIVLQEGEGESTIFPSGIPRDEVTTTNPVLFGIISFLAVIGILFATFCLIFNLIFIKRKYIKLTSPIINVVICIGAGVLYLEVIILGVPSEDFAVQSGLCNLALWTASFGFTLVFGSLVVKTWRIYYIFHMLNSAKPQKKGFKPPKDWILLAVIGALLIVDLVFLIPVTAVENSRFFATTQKRQFSAKSDLVCNSNAHLPIMAVFLIYKSIYLWIGLFLAFETRKVKTEALNDAKFIAAAVYCTVVSSIPLVAVGLLLSIHVEARYGTLSGGILFVTTIILCLLFIPRMIGLFRRWNDNTIDTALDFSIPQTLPQSVTVNHQEIATLKQENENLKMKLDEFKCQVKPTSI